jgi:hypothetical protein
MPRHGIFLSLRCLTLPVAVGFGMCGAIRLCEDRAGCSESAPLCSFEAASLLFRAERLER